MILIAILALWMVVLAVVVAACVAASRGDRGGTAQEALAGTELPEMIVVELSSRGEARVRRSGERVRERSGRMRAGETVEHPLLLERAMG